MILVPSWWVLTWFYLLLSFSPAVLTSVQAVIIASLDSAIAKKLHICLHFVQLVMASSTTTVSAVSSPHSYGLGCLYSRPPLTWHSHVTSCQVVVAHLKLEEEFGETLLMGAAMNFKPLPLVSFCIMLPGLALHLTDPDPDLQTSWLDLRSCLFTMNLSGDLDSWSSLVINTRSALFACMYYKFKTCVLWDQAYIGVVFIFQLASPFRATDFCRFLTQLSIL